MGFTIKIDDRQVKRFMQQSPARAKWANTEALKMTGGHIRKKARKYIESGGQGWPPLSPLTKHRRSPLYFMGRLIRWRYGTAKGIPKVAIGFFPTAKRRKRERIATGSVYKISTTKTKRAAFKSYFGMTYDAFMKMVEYGKRIRVTPAMRKRFAAVGTPLRASTKVLNIPARPILGPIYRKEQNLIPKYYETKFFQKFFSKENPAIRI